MNDARVAAAASWSDLDRRDAVHRADRDAIDASAAVRALVIELASAGGAPADELYDACAALGRLYAEHGASPTLASASVDNAARALGADGADWRVPARAALAEAFSSTVVEAAQRRAAEAWEFPRCAVPLGEGAVAVAAGYPSDDDEALAGWSARVAKQAALRGFRRAVVSGGERACAALIDAMRLVGIDVKRV